MPTSQKSAENQSPKASKPISNPSQKLRRELQLKAKVRLDKNRGKLSAALDRQAELRDQVNDLKAAIKQDEALIVSAVNEDVQLDLFPR